MNCIEVKNVSKKYWRECKQRIFLKDFFQGFKRNEQEDYFWALKHVTFNVQQGESIGIVGENGSGKSTLLKVLAGVTQPTEGSFQIKGRVYSLIELGAGFNPELSGRENIYVNGSILGLRMKEIKRRFDEIVDFSELQDFIDMPIRTYSTGMYLRLGFSIAVITSPEIMLIDEALTVGDEYFRAKCIERIQSLQYKNKTIVFVSHSLDLLKRITNKSILLNKGEVVDFDDTSTILGRYQKLLFNKVKSRQELRAGQIISTSRDQLKIEDAKTVNGDGIEQTHFVAGETIRLLISYLPMSVIEEDIYIGIAIFRSDALCIGSDDTMKLFSVNRESSSRHTVEYKLETAFLQQGLYYVNIAVFNNNCLKYYVFEKEKIHFIVDSKHRKSKSGIIYLEGKWQKVMN